MGRFFNAIWPFRYHSSINSSFMDIGAANLCPFFSGPMVLLRPIFFMASLWIYKSFFNLFDKWYYLCSFLFNSGNSQRKKDVLATQELQFKFHLNLTNIRHHA